MRPIAFSPFSTNILQNCFAGHCDYSITGQLGRVIAGISQLLEPGSFDQDPKMIADATNLHSDEKKSHTMMKIDGMEG